MRKKPNSSARPLHPLALKIRARGYSQRDFARKLKVTPAMVSLWVKGRRLPGPRVCGDAATALGMSAEELLEMVAPAVGVK
jgi:transcriptional regulator with XRE-family HTH domain